MKAILKYFGLIKFQEHLDLVKSLRNANSSLSAEVSTLKRESKELKDLMGQAHTAITNSIEKNAEHTEFIVEQYDPARFVYESSSRSFKDKTEANDYYEAMKLEKPHGIQASVSLYRKVTLRTTKAERVPSK